MRAVISFDIPDSWELWSIEIDDDCPDEITAEWLEANTDKWEFYDLEDRGGDTRANLIVERFGD